MKNNSSFQLHIQSDLSAGDFKVLALLYQPLLGLGAHALYVTFYQLLNRTGITSMTHAELFDLLDLRQADFLNMRHKLEALGLMMTYQKEDQFRYFLKAPLTAKQFLVDTVFGSYLQSEIGEKNTALLASMFKIDVPDVSDHDNITKAFDALYEFKSLGLLNVKHPLQGRQPNGGSHITYKFDYDGFVERIPERLKNSQLLNLRFKEQITKIAFVYQFGVEDMVAIYEQAAKSRQTVNFNQLNLKARLHYQKQNQQLSIQEKDLSETNILSQITPQVIIQKYARTDQQGIALSTATSLLERNHVEPGIVNVILMLVLKHKDGVLPNLNYMEKVLMDWLNKGVQSTQDAIAHSQQLETQWQKKKPIRKVAEPDWLDEYIAEIAEMEG